MTDCLIRAAVRRCRNLLTGDSHDQRSSRPDDTFKGPAPAPAGGLRNVTRRPTPVSSGRRTLALSGTWAAHGDSFRLEVTIAVAPDAAASGVIWWSGIRRPALRGHEEVGGHVRAPSVVIRGVKADSGLACDRYRISLSGDDRRGTFTGVSWAFGSSQGQLSGTYLFVDDAAPSS